MGRLTLVLGGVRSGKSRFAEELAAAEPPVAYLATAHAGDEEMARRIEAHRRRRPVAWRTVEEPWDVPRIVGGEQAGTVLLECLTLWLTNLLVGLPDRKPLTDAAVLERVDALVQAIQDGTSRAVVVSNEVGWGVMPVNALARRFGDLLGEANQRLAAAAADVYLCVAGLPLRLK